MILRARRRSKLRDMHRADFEAALRDSAGLTTFVLFDTGSADDRLAAEALADAAAAHADGLRAFRAPAAEFADYIDGQTAAKRAFDSYDFVRRPCVGVYRAGRLVTTLSPRRIFHDSKLQARETRTQVEIFIEKFCYFDPQYVREQTNIAEAMKHEAAEKAAKDAAKSGAEDAAEPGAEA